MKQLPEDFKIHRYGIDCRLVTEEDSQFILSLRTNEKLTRYLHTTDQDLDKQIEWIRNYKKRFQNGEDFYFIYYHNGEPFGVNRIYNISGNKGTGGSWVCKPGSLPEVSIASLLLMRDILFEQLELDYDLFDVQFGNNQVKKLHLMMGAKKVGETGNQENFSLFKDDYEEKKQTLINILSLTI